MKNSFDEKILEEANDWIKTNQKVVLATVIQTWGSSPRQIGSRMIVNEKGDFSGSVSGGCVESAVVRECLNILKENKPFKKCYNDIAETFRSKPTGNRVLGFVCSYCPYKLPCWGRDKLQLLPQQQSKGKNPKWVWYTSVTNPKEETEEFSGG